MGAFVMFSSSTPPGVLVEDPFCYWAFQKVISRPQGAWYWKELKMREETLLEVFDTRPEAENQLHRYARLCKAKGLTPACRVKVAPVRKHRYQGTWGVWLVKRGNPK